MIADQVNITRLMFDLRQSAPKQHWQAIYSALIEDRYTQGEWPKHKHAENVGQIRRLGGAGLAKIAPDAGKESIDWLLGVLAVKRRPGRPRKIAA